MNEIFIQVKGIGFTFLINKKMKHNFVSPAFLAFFNFGGRQMYSLSENNIGKVNTKPVYDNLQPFLPDYVDSISTNDVFHYVGKKVGRCKDNKLGYARCSASDLSTKDALSLSLSFLTRVWMCLPC